MGHEPTSDGSPFFFFTSVWVLKKIRLYATMVSDLT